MTQKIVLITGANKGLGLETARQLAGKGFHVLLGARDAAKGTAAAATLAGSGGTITPISIDVTDPASIKQAVAHITEKFGHLDILINNAGINIEFSNSISPDAVTVDIMKETFETNVFGAFAVLQAFVPLLEKAQGRVINVSSKLGSLGIASDPTSYYYPFVIPAYNASKTALNALTVSYAKAYAPKGISITSICPGWVRTELGSDAAPRSVEEGVQVIIEAATAQKPYTGTYFDDDGPIVW